MRDCVVSNLVDVSTRFVVHLFRAVEHVDHDAKTSSQIFGGLSFSGSSRASGCSAHSQVE